MQRSIENWFLALPCLERDAYHLASHSLCPFNQLWPTKMRLRLFFYRKHSPNCEHKPIATFLLHHERAAATVDGIASAHGEVVRLRL